MDKIKISALGFRLQFQLIAANMKRRVALNFFWLLTFSFSAEALEQVKTLAEAGKNPQ